MSANETRLSVALVHYPCLDKFGGIQCTSITNLDVHDIARSSRTYGTAAFYVVTPVQAQQDMAKAIVGFWEDGKGRDRNPHRTEAMERVHVSLSVEDAIKAETAVRGVKPIVVATSARATPRAIPYSDMRARLEAGAHVLLLFGTGHGLAPSLLELCDEVLVPLVGVDDPEGGYNHLSVRSAAAVIFDRLRGLRDD